MTGDELLVASGHGDRHAFALLYDRIVGPVHSAVLGVVGDPELADEVTAEVFIELWRTAPRFCPSAGTACAWAVALARRRGAEYRALSPRVRADALRGGAEHGTEGATRDADDPIGRDRGASLLATLPPSARPACEALELVHHGFGSYREVADELDVAPATVLQWLRAGLRQLQDDLANAASVGGAQGREA